MPRPTGISEQLYFYALDGFENYVEETSAGLEYNGSLVTVKANGDLSAER